MTRLSGNLHELFFAALVFIASLRTTQAQCNIGSYLDDGDCERELLALRRGACGRPRPVLPLRFVPPQLTCELTTAAAAVAAAALVLLCRMLHSWPGLVRQRDHVCAMRNWAGGPRCFKRTHRPGPQPGALVW